MPRPQSKEDLLQLSKQNYQKLQELIASYSEAELHKEFPSGTLNRNIRDVLAHLHHWHLLMIDWYTIGMKGEKPEMPAKGYTWKTLPDFNRKVWELYQNSELIDIQSKLEDSFQKVRAIIEAHSNEDLFEKKRYKWTGTTSLAAYLISNTSSHYDWAIKRIKKSMKGV